MSSPLEQLTATALLGTERRPPSPPASSSSALTGALACQPWDSDSPSALLAAAALIAVHHRAGRTAAKLEAALDGGAPDERARPCSPAAAGLLEELLSDRLGRRLIDDWLRRVAAQDQLAPPVLLPELLDVATREPELRAPLREAGGTRLGWLAAHREEWAWATIAAGEDSERAWDLATVEARLLLLSATRAEHPGRGRALLERTWGADPAEQRARFLQALAPTLALDDEPLLERALDDGRREVRAAAADLLATLPGSAYQRRMWSRVEPLVRLEGLPRRFAVALPPDPDDAAVRDNVAGLTGAGLGRRAAHLAELVGALDLGAWTRHLREPPAAIVARAAGGENGDALFAGWVRAAERQRNPEWSAALALGLGDPTPLAAVPATAVEAAALELLRASDDDRRLLILRSLAAPWPASVSAVAVDRLQRPGATVMDFTEFAYRLHPAVIEQARASLGELERPPVAMMRALDLRRALIRELPTR